MIHGLKDGLQGCDAAALQGSCKAPDGGATGVSLAACRRAWRIRTGRCIGCPGEGLNSHLHTVTDGQGRPIRMLLTARQRHDTVGAMMLLARLPVAKRLLADAGHDADWFQEGRQARGIEAYMKRRHKIREPIGVS